jgi:hypothetical protein
MTTGFSDLYHALVWQRGIFRLHPAAKVPHFRPNQPTW